MVLFVESVFLFGETCWFEVYGKVVNRFRWVSDVSIFAFMDGIEQVEIVPGACFVSRAAVQ